MKREIEQTKTSDDLIPIDNLYEYMREAEKHRECVHVYVRTIKL